MSLGDLRNSEITPTNGIMGKTLLSVTKGGDPFPPPRGRKTNHQRATRAAANQYCHISRYNYPSNECSIIRAFTKTTQSGAVGKLLTYVRRSSFRFRRLSLSSSSSCVVSHSRLAFSFQQCWTPPTTQISSDWSNVWCVPPSGFSHYCHHRNLVLHHVLYSSDALY